MRQGLVFCLPNGGSIGWKFHNLSWTKLMMLIYQVLLLHRGPIHRFILSISQVESCYEIDQLILFVLRNGVQEFSFHIWRGDLHKLPVSLFSYSQLTHLDLRGCIFKPPSTFKGFGSLICLVLCEVSITPCALASLISRCPYLNK